MSFLLFGIIIGVVIGYFQNAMNIGSGLLKFGKFFESMMKIFEAIPLLLWILLTVIFIELFFPQYNEFTKARLTFILFGIYSSSALSTLIADKIRDLKAEEFITSLRLQGIPKYKIIYSHIIICFCLPIIGFQVAYNIMQTIFLDITLNILEFGYLGSWGKLIWELIQIESPFSFHILSMTVIVFSFIYIFYTIAQYCEYLSTAN